MIKPRVGFLFIGCDRFKKLGDGCADGNYAVRRGKFVDGLVGKFGEIADCFYPGIVWTKEDVDNAITYFKGKKVDTVVCSFLSWSEDFNWIYFLREMYDLPLAYYLPVNPNVPYKDTRDENDFVEFLAQGGLVGALIGSSSSVRQQKPVTPFVGQWDEVKERFIAYFSACHARSALRRAKFGLINTFNPIMRGTFIDPYDIFTRIGPELNFYSYEMLRQATEAVDEKRAENYLQELSKRYVVEKDIEHRLFLASVRASLAVGDLRDKNELDAVILNDVSTEIFETLGLRPGFYPETFFEHNATFSPEGDLGSGLAVYILHQLTGRHINYIEPFYIEASKGIFSAGHAGPHDYTDPSYKHLVRISRDTRFAKTNYKYAGAPFAWYRISPGQKTILHISQGANGRFKMIAFLAESLPGEHALCSYCHSDFRVNGDQSAFFEKVLACGVTQHFAAVDGNVMDALEFLAKQLDFDFFAPGR